MASEVDPDREWQAYVDFIEWLRSPEGQAAWLEEDRRLAEATAISIPWPEGVEAIIPGMRGCADG